MDRQTLKMAVAFENCDVVLSEERAQHINERHVRLDINTQASKFKQNFQLVSCLARLTKMTWKERSDYEIIAQGFKQGHGLYYIYVFTLPKVIGTDPWGFPSRKICIYFSWRPSRDQRFQIVSAYPYSASYDSFLWHRKNGYSM